MRKFVSRMPKGKPLARMPREGQSRQSCDIGQHGKDVFEIHHCGLMMLVRSGRGRKRYVLRLAPYGELCNNGMVAGRVRLFALSHNRRRGSQRCHEVPIMIRLFHLRAKTFVRERLWISCFLCVLTLFNARTPSNRARRKKPQPWSAGNRSERVRRRL